LAAVALGAVLFVIAWRVMAPPDALAGFNVVERSAGARVEASATTLALLAGELSVKADGARIDLSAGTTIAHEPPGARVQQGQATFKVDKRPPGSAPYRVLVSHGVIEVLGTRFLVTQREGNGEVRLDEGSVRFISTDGREVTLSPGATLAWPLPVPAEPP